MVQRAKDYFQATISPPTWITIGDRDVQLYYDIYQKSLRLVFQGTTTLIDIATDMEARLLNSKAIAPYKGMNSRWLAHRGFVTGYKSVRDFIHTLISHVELIGIFGYSMGGAYASLAYEDITFNFPDKRADCFIYGASRVFWFPSCSLRKRLKPIVNVRHRRDFIAHLPPWILGYTHIGTHLPIGDNGSLKWECHTIASYQKALDITWRTDYDSTPRH